MIEMMIRILGIVSIKAGASFAWLNGVQAPAVLCENFFVDGPNAAVYASQDALKSLAKAYAVAVLEYCNMRYVEDVYSYRVHVIDYNYSVHTGKLQGTLQEGSIYAPLRTILAMVDYGVYYNDKTRELTVFPEQLFDEASFADGAITLEEIAAMGSLDAWMEADAQDDDWDDWYVANDDAEYDDVEPDYSMYEEIVFDFDGAS